MKRKQKRVAYCSLVAHHTILVWAGVTESCAPECHGRSSVTTVVQCTHTVLLIISTLQITQAYRHTHAVYSLKFSLETFTCLLLHSALLTALSSDFDFFTWADNMRSELHCSVTTSGTWLTSDSAQFLLQKSKLLKRLSVWTLICGHLVHSIWLIAPFAVQNNLCMGFWVDHQWKREL